MESISSFDQLPSAVNKIFERLAKIEQLLNEKEDEPQKTVDTLLTIEEAAEFLSLAVPTLYSMVSRQQIPYMKPAKRLYFSRLDLMEYLKTGRRKTNEEISAEADRYLLSKKAG